MKSKLAIILLSGYLLCGCAAVDRYVFTQDPETGQIVKSPYFEAAEDAFGWIPGWGQIAGTALGVLSLAYINFRKGKMNEALVDGIEAFRLKLRGSGPQGIELDESFLSLLKKIQEKAGVNKAIASLVDSRTDYTREN